MKKTENETLRSSFIIGEKIWKKKKINCLKKREKEKERVF